MSTAYHGRTHSRNGTDPIPGLNTPTGRMVWGGIYNDTTTPLVIGSGDWSVAISGNEYTITFDEAFDNPPVVLTTPNCNNAPGAGADQGYFAVLTTRLAGSVVMKTYKQDGTADDGGFDFLCLGDAA